MHEPGSLSIEDCWQPGGRVRVEVLGAAGSGARVRLSGTPDGFVGLARMLLYLAHHGLEDGRIVSLDAFEGMAPGSPVLELADAATEG